VHDRRDIQLPVDPDVGGEPASRLGWDRDVLLVIFAGGCLGGWARYAVTSAAAAGRYAFPWSTFAVNVIGAFVLGAVVVVAMQRRSRRLLRPLVGTGFCGALTTFSSVVVAAAQMFAHHRAATAAGYLAATTVAGVAAAYVGMAAARGVVRG
jgi:CrcB protein